MSRCCSQKKHGTQKGGALSGLCSAGVLCTAPDREMPFYGEQDLLLELPCALLLPGYAGEDPHGHAVFRPADAVYHPVLAIRHLVESTKEKEGWIGYEVKKLVYLLLGCLGLGLGAVGAVLPMLPAFPFLMLAACCFAKSSARLDRWFRGTKLYRTTWKAMSRAGA